MLNQNVDFDAFSVTIASSEADLIHWFLSKIDLSGSRPIRGKNGYNYGAEIHRGDNQFCKIFWGNGTSETHVTIMGENSGLIRSLVLDYCQTHKCTAKPSRIDSRVDWCDEGLFDRLANLFQDFAVEKGIKINMQGDWVRGQSRTLYIGSRQSQLMVRLYEKGCQVGGDPNWIRFETEVKPKKLEAKLAVIKRSAPEVLYTGWAGEFLESLGFIGTIKTVLPSAYRPADDERARRALVKQYGKILTRWQHETGDWDSLGSAIERKIIETEKEQYA